MGNRRKKSWALLISWRKLCLFLMGVFLLFLMHFFLYGFTKTFQQQIYQSSSYLRSFFQQYEGKPLIFLLEQENLYYGQALDKESFQFGQFLLELSMSINLKNPSSFLLAELPGFRLFDVQLMVDDGESSFFNISNEPIPDREEIERKDESESFEIPKEEKSEKISSKPKEESASSASTLKKIVYIYHTHNRETFHQSDDEVKYSKINNITRVGQRLGQALEEYGIGVDVDTTDISGKVIQKNLNYAASYDVSREVVKKHLQKEKETKFIFDIHRDAIQRDLTTIKIGEKNYARIAFVIGGENKNYKKNLRLATELHERLNKRYEGISRNIVVKKGKGVNGVYNQDLSENALTIEFGGVGNHLYEFYRTAEVFAEVLADYIQEESRNQ